MNIAHYMTQGVDVWLNTPRRPKEASGTSGMKVIYNGGLNASILDGWWAEGYKYSRGWAIGSGEEYTTTASGFAAPETTQIDGIIALADAQLAAADVYTDTVLITLLP